MSLYLAVDGTGSDADGAALRGIEESIAGCCRGIRRSLGHSGFGKLVVDAQVEVCTVGGDDPGGGIR